MLHMLQSCRLDLGVFHDLGCMSSSLEYLSPLIRPTRTFLPLYSSFAYLQLDQPVRMSSIPKVHSLVPFVTLAP